VKEGKEKARQERRREEKRRKEKKRKEKKREAIALSSLIWAAAVYSIEQETTACFSAFTTE